MAQNNGCKGGNKRLEAMTLIEVLAALVIIAVLASIAVPSYQALMTKSTRSVVISDLNRIQLYLENGYNGSYVDAKDAIMSGAHCLLCESSSQHYSVTVSAANDSYLISADPRHRQEHDRCLPSSSDIITLDHTGTVTPAACW